jgi:hypothetical protein
MPHNFTLMQSKFTYTPCVLTHSTHAHIQTHTMYTPHSHPHSAIHTNASTHVAYTYAPVLNHIHAFPPTGGPLGSHAYWHTYAYTKIHLFMLNKHMQFPLTLMHIRPVFTHTCTLTQSQLHSLPALPPHSLVQFSQESSARSRMGCIRISCCCRGSCLEILSWLHHSFCVHLCFSLKESYF